MLKLTSGGSIFAPVCVLLVGCGGLFSGGMERFHDVFEKIPLPPNTNEFIIDGEDSTDFYVRATYTDRSAVDIASFYRTFFTDNGWTSNYPPEEESDDQLNYQKGNASAHITTIAIGSEIQLVIIYREDEFSRDEFDTKAGESVSPEAKALVESVRETYEKATTYADTGTHELIDDGEVLGSATFKTAYKYPGDLLFEYWGDTDNFHFFAYAIGKNGDHTQYMTDTDSEPTLEKDVTMAIGAYYGVTSGTSGNVPELLLKLNGSVLFHLIDLHILKEAKAEDGTLCTLLHGKDALGQENTIWIGKEDLLIRKIESVEDKDNRQTTIYSPKVNVEIADEDLAFRKPVAKN